MCYFSVFKELSGTEFNYDISLVHYEYDEVAGQDEVFRALSLTKELCFYRQNVEEGVDWKIILIPLFSSTNKERQEI